MGRLIVVYCHVSSSKGGSPTCVDWGPIIWPRWIRLIMYWHTQDLLGPTNLVASIIDELDNTPPYLMDVHWDSVGPPMDAYRGITWKTCTRVRWARLNSLIVVVNYGHSWCLHGSHVSWCLDYVPCKVSTTPSVMGEAYLLQLFCRSAISPLFIWDLRLCLMWLLGCWKLILLKVVDWDTLHA
jgi:hypothetical protein